MRTTIPPVVLREESEDIGRNPTDNPTIGDVIAARFARRDILKGALGVAAIAATVSPLALAAASRAQAETASRFRFEELEAGADENHHVAAGYDADVLIRWGDPVLPGAPPFNPNAHTAAAQRLQFGYNNDFLAYFPMPGAANPSHARPARGQSRIHQRGADVCGSARGRNPRTRRVRRLDARARRRSKWPRMAAR